MRVVTDPRRLLQFAIKLRRPGWLAAQDVIGCRQTLQTLVVRLPQVSKEIGARYLKSASLLEPLTNSSEALLRESEALLNLAVGQSEGDSVIAGTTALLQPAFDYLEGWRIEVQNRAAELAECAEVVAQVQDSEGRLRELVAPLTHIQTMFRIESAGLPADLRQIFTGLTSDIANVNHEVSETFGQQFEMVSSSLGTLRDIRSRIGVQALEIGNALLRHQDQVSESLNQLRLELAKNTSHDIELSTTSRHIGDAVSRIVMALQVHDIISQRLDAVRTSITQARELITQSRSKGQEAWCVVAIQKGQVDGVRQQLQEAERALQAGAAEINLKVNALDTDCLLLKEFEEVTVASNGSIELSFDMIGNAAQLLAEVIACSDDFHQSMKPLGRLTNSLTGSLEKLSNQMRLIALNAQVQAVQIGSGTGLEVLAAQTAAVSRDTSALIDDISSGIGRVVTIVQGLTLSFEQTVDRGKETLGALNRLSSTHKERLHDLRDRTFGKLRLVGEAVDQIRHCAVSLAEETNVRQTALAALKDAASLLERVDGIFKRSLGRIDASAATQAVGTYRMKAERDVHQAVLQSLSGNVAEPAGAAAEVPLAAADAECQVELF